MGAGLPMDKGDVAFKCNFATAKKVRSTVHVIVCMYVCVYSEGLG